MRSPTAIVVLLLCGCGSHFASNLTAADVSKVEVWVGQQVDGSPGFGPFDAAAEDFERILGLLREGAVEQKPYKWQVLGTLMIHRRNGEKVEVDLFWARADKGAYRIGQTYYRGSTDKEIIDVLVDCFKRSQGS